MTATLPDVEMPAHQIAFPKPRNHRWDYENERRIAACDSPSKCDQNERDCIHCRLVRVTVHPPGGFPFRAWRLPNSKTQFVMGSTPKCEPRVIES
jgi:hypothetical protein